MDTAHERTNERTFGWAAAWVLVQVKRFSWTASAMALQQQQCHVLEVIITVTIGELMFKVQNTNHRETAWLRSQPPQPPHDASCCVAGGLLVAAAAAVQVLLRSYRHPTQPWSVARSAGSPTRVRWSGNNHATKILQQNHQSTLKTQSQGIYAHFGTLR